ncbi:hypothetical protein K7432_001720 [Basidiobolus ranarum]|uniref:ubiquitinyl hydrolase 1 n=1 Tax=Basidiobolus ranarum TaxID=34480 RepID=A0ABR2X2K4_9FUNG
MDDVEVNHQRIEEINDEELTAKEDEIAPLEECSLETPVKKFKKADPKLFEMKISSQASGRSIPANFTLTNIITLGKRRQDVDEAKEVTSLPFLKLGDTIICEWEREVADYVFDNAKNEMDTDDNRRGLWSTFEIFQDPNESPIEKSQEKKDITLDDCLEEFVKEEQLGEDDPWYCPNCKKHQQALKKFDLWRLPDFLVVHLKRFSHTRSWRNKIDVLVDFPVSDLDLSPRVLSESSETNGMVYDLYAISNHYGGLGGGHYTAYAYNYEEERGYHYDDSMVEPVDVESIKTTAAYLLFYKRRGAEIHLPDLSKIEQQKEQLPANGHTDQMQLTPFNPSLGNSDHIEYSDEELDKDMEISMSDSRSSPDFM